MRKGRGKKESVVENTIIGNKMGMGCKYNVIEKQRRRKRKLLHKDTSHGQAARWFSTKYLKFRWSLT